MFLVYFFLALGMVWAFSFPVTNLYKGHSLGMLDAAASMGGFICILLCILMYQFKKRCLHDETLHVRRINSLQGMERYQHEIFLFEREGGLTPAPPTLELRRIVKDVHGYYPQKILFIPEDIGYGKWHDMLNVLRNKTRAGISFHETDGKIGFKLWILESPDGWTFIPIEQEQSFKNGRSVFA